MELPQLMHDAGPYLFFSFMSRSSACQARSHCYDLQRVGETGTGEQMSRIDKTDGSRLHLL